MQGGCIVAKMHCESIDPESRQQQNGIHNFQVPEVLETGHLITMT